MTIASFSQYLVEEEKTVFFTFGRCNPPTIGHGKLLDVMGRKAMRNPYRLYLSQSQDVKNNPLSYSDKVKHLRKMFPKHARKIMINKKIKNALDVMVALFDEGFQNVVMVVGSDRVREFDILLNKYNRIQSRHGFYNFKTIKVISAGIRDVDSNLVEGASASKQRSFAENKDFTLFSQNVPSSMTNADTRRLYNDTRKGLGLKEEKSFKNHIALESVSETREKFVAGDLFELGDEVVILESEEVGTVAVLGANYIIVETNNGERTRKWLSAVEKLE